jgi:hypothetical protein
VHDRERPESWGAAYANLGLFLFVRLFLGVAIVGLRIARLRVVEIGRAAGRERV